MTRIPEWFFRCLGSVAFTVFAVLQARRYDLYENELLFVLETLVYVLLAAAYVTRRPAAERAEGAAEIVLPLIGAVLPFAFLFKEPTLQGGSELILWTLAVGTGLKVAGLASLRRSFSILVEARAPVTSGLYRVIRHPVYAGQLVAGAAVVAWRFAWWTVLLYFAFLAIQVARAALEERKLARLFPEYADYTHRTWRFVPFVY